ncbi:MAG: AAA family ATPase [Candidatus Woesearchaeota archaeon]
MDDLFGRYLSCIYGAPATGKTNICLLLAAKASKSGKVFFIDTENTFSPERIKDFNGKLCNILVLKPKNFRDQCTSTDNLLKLKDKVKLVIVDSLSMHYRPLIQQKADINPRLSRQLSILSEIAKDSCPVIITCQVYANLEGQIMPVGGNMVKNWSSAVINVRQERDRKMIVEKHPNGKRNIAFEINSRGIDFF